MLVVKALNFAAEAHRDQTRKFSELPYIVHPMTVALLVTQFKPNSKNIVALQCAAILHDTVEDTGVIYRDIESEFGMLTASLVFELTTDEEEKMRLGKLEYLKKRFIGYSSYALFLKLLDRLANILDKPTEKTIQDTRELINHLLQNRMVSVTHHKVIEAIEEVIEKFRIAQFDASFEEYGGFTEISKALESK